ANDKISVEQGPDLVPHILNNLLIQRQLPQPRSVVPRLPLPVRLRALHPLPSFAGDGVHGAASEELPLHQQPLLLVPWDRRVQHVEQRRVVGQRLAEARHEEGRAVGAVGDAEDEQVGPEAPDVVEDGVPGAPRHRRTYVAAAVVYEPPERAEAVDDEELVRIDAEIVGADRLPPGRHDALELERHAELAGAAAEAAPRLVEARGWPEPILWLWDIDAGDPHLRRATLHGRQMGQQGGPLRPEVDAVIHDLAKLKDVILKQHDSRYSRYALRYSTSELELRRFDTSADLYAWVPVPASRAASSWAKQCASRWLGSPLGDDCFLICASSLAALARSLEPTARAQWMSKPWRRRRHERRCLEVRDADVELVDDDLGHHLPVSLLLRRHRHLQYHQFGVPTTASTCHQGHRVVFIVSSPLVLAMLLVYFLPAAGGSRTTVRTDEEAAGAAGGGQELVGLLHPLEERQLDHVRLVVSPVVMMVMATTEQGREQSTMLHVSVGRGQGCGCGGGCGGSGVLLVRCSRRILLARQ
ncbi:hypothetical protein U9M48_000212, partial [Paspalum notatum var. saurae]